MPCTLFVMVLVLPLNIRVTFEGPSHSEIRLFSFEVFVLLKILNEVQKFMFTFQRFNNSQRLTSCSEMLLSDQ